MWLNHRAMMFQIMMPLLVLQSLQSFDCRFYCNGASGFVCPGTTHYCFHLRTKVPDPTDCLVILALLQIKHAYLACWLISGFFTFSRGRHSIKAHISQWSHPVLCVNTYTNLITAKNLTLFVASFRANSPKKKLKYFQWHRWLRFFNVLLYLHFIWKKRR